MNGSIFRLLIIPLVPCFFAMSACKKLEREMLVVTGDAMNITVNSADVGGQIIDLGEGATQYGHCYGEAPGVTVLGTKTTHGPPMAVGGYTSVLTGLKSGTVYYVKAYMSSGDITVYGKETYFTTVTISLPIVITSGISDISVTSAAGGGNVIADGGSAVTECGLVWSKDGDPSTDNNDGMTVDGSGTGSFTGSLTGLDPETTYNVRAYATNGAGTAYGALQTFRTYYDMMSDQDGNVYGTVLIGEQEWMAENLRTAVYRDGSAIPGGLSDTEWENTTSGAFAIFPHTNIAGLDSDEDVLRAYGAHYNGYAVRTGELCPAGWRVPDYDDWSGLTGYLLTYDWIDENNLGNILKSCRQVNSPLGGGCATTAHPRWNEHDIHYGTDDFGFAGLPGERRETDGSFGMAGGSASWWSAMGSSSTAGCMFHLSYSDGNWNLCGAEHELNHGFSIRCLKGEAVYLTLPAVTTAGVSGITETEATGGGEITSDGGTEVTARGVVWSTADNPTLEQAENGGSTEDGSGTGHFTSGLGGLSPGTTYYVRAYATNSEGTAYGDQESFTTLFLNVGVTDLNLGPDTGSSADFSIESNINWTVSSDESWLDIDPVSGSNDGLVSVTAASENTSSESRSTVITVSWSDGSGMTRSITVAQQGFVAGLPTVITGGVTSIGGTSATVGGEVTGDGGSAVIDRGIYYDITPGPENSGVEVSIGEGTGSFSATITGLAPETNYFIRAYAANDQGTGFGDQVSFTTLLADYTTPGSGVTDINGNTYKTVIIGNQEWMAENLQTTLYRYGETIIYPGSDNSAWEGNTDGAYSWYDNIGDNKLIYGALYNFYAISGYYRLCPTGWRVPDDEDWTELTDYIINEYAEINPDNAGNTLKSCRQVDSPLGGDCATSEHPRWDSDNVQYGKDNFGFSALPGGYRHHHGGFGFEGAESRWWSSSENPDGNGWIRRMSYDMGYAGRYENQKNSGYYVRCLKGDIPTLTTNDVTDITSATATSGGYITDNAGSGITARGVVWGTSERPSLVVNLGVTNDGTGTEGFVSSITGLDPSTTYFVRAYATNSNGTAYGNQLSFTTGAVEGFACGDNVTFSYRGEEVTYGTVEGQNGTCWMDRNLGASRVATSYNDSEAYGDLFQWGRLADGHQDRGSGTTSTLSGNDSPGHGNFITASSDPYDWRDPQNDNLWQGDAGTNDVCPAGWRVPTETELDNERLSWSSNDYNGAFAGPLKLAAGGGRESNGDLSLVGSYGIYWSSSISADRSVNFVFTSSTAGNSVTSRVFGRSIRCIRDN